MTSLSADKLSIRFGNQVILDQISIHLQPGEVLVLLGPNGSGKSTLLRLLARQLLPNSGQVFLESVPFHRYSHHQLAKQIGLMPQHESKDLPLSVYDVVALGRVPHRGWFLPLSSNDESIVSESLAVVGLTELRDRTVESLSGGEWRRMILARALSQDTPIILLDEPTSGLDVKFQLECLEVISRLVKKRNLVCLVSLHDLNHAGMFGDRVALLASGRLKAIGTAEEVMRPEILREAFGVEVLVLPHPSGGRDLVIPCRSLSNP